MKLAISIVVSFSWYNVRLPSEKRIAMALPGSQNYPAPKTEVEALTQITQLLFNLTHEITNLRVELHNMNSNLQTISGRIH